MISFIAKYFHIRGEGRATHPGFNFYPLSERKTHIGFRFLAGPLVVSVRWRKKGLTPRFLVRAKLFSPEQRCKRCAKAFEEGMVMVPREAALEAGIKC